MLASCNWEWGWKHITLHSQTNSNHTHCMFKHSSECSKHLHVVQPPPPPTHIYTHVNTTTNTDQRPYIHVVQTSHTHCYNTSPQLYSPHTLLQHFTSAVLTTHTATTLYPAALTTHTATTLHLSCTHHTHCYNTAPQLHSPHTLLQHCTSAALATHTATTLHLSCTHQSYFHYCYPTDTALPRLGEHKTLHCRYTYRQKYSSTIGIYPAHKNGSGKWTTDTYTLRETVVMLG